MIKNRKKYLKEYYLNNKNRINQYHKQWKLKNKEKIKKYQKQYNNTEHRKQLNKEHCRRWYLKNKERHQCCTRAYKLKTRFGISFENYNSLLIKQNSVCAICKKHETVAKDCRTNKIRNLAVDHDHKTGKIRGLLCYNCNIGLGKFYESIETLQSALCYLELNKNG